MDIQNRSPCFCDKNICCGYSSIPHGMNKENEHPSHIHINLSHYVHGVINGVLLLSIAFPPLLGVVHELIVNFFALLIPLCLFRWKTLRKNSFSYFLVFGSTRNNESKENNLWSIEKIWLIFIDCFPLNFWENNSISHQTK